MDKIDNALLLQLLAKHQEGNLLPEEEKLLDNWFSSLQITDTRWYANQQDEATQLNLLWQSIDEKTAIPLAPVVKKTAFQKYWWAAAAILTGVVLSILWMTPGRKKEELAVRPPAPSPPAVIAVVKSLTAAAPFGTVKKITLPDGSTVWLNSGASLRYPEKFEGRERNVSLLKGQAFFQVAHDHLHPFKVQGAGLVTQVLGTSFEIKITSKKVVVAVATGKVKVSRHDSTELGRLQPGNQLAYNNNTGKAIQSNVDLGGVAPWRSKQIRLEKAAFADLSDALQTIYGVKVKAGDDEVLKQTYSITLQYNTDLQDMIEVLASIHGNTYDISKNTVTFKRVEP